MYLCLNKYGAVTNAVKNRDKFCPDYETCENLLALKRTRHTPVTLGEKMNCITPNWKPIFYNYGNTEYTSSEEFQF